MNYTCGYCQKYIKPGELIQTVFERKVSYSRVKYYGTTFGQFLQSLTSKWTYKLFIRTRTNSFRIYIRDRKTEIKKLILVSFCMLSMFILSSTNTNRGFISNTKWTLNLYETRKPNSNMDFNRQQGMLTRTLCW